MEFQRLFPFWSTSNVIVTGLLPSFCTHPVRCAQPANRKGSEYSFAFTSSLAQTAPVAVTGPSSSGIETEVNHKFELDCPGPSMPPFAFRLFRNSFFAESSQPNTSWSFHRV